MEKLVHLEFLTISDLTHSAPDQCKIQQLVWNGRCRIVDIGTNGGFFQSSEVEKHLYVRGDAGVKFSLGKVHTAILEKPHWRLLDYAGKPLRPFFSQYFVLTPRAANSKSLLLPANLCSRTVMDFCFFIRHLVLQPAHSNCYHTADGKFHLGFFTANKWLVCW